MQGYKVFLKCALMGNIINLCTCRRFYKTDISISIELRRKNEKCVRDKNYGSSDKYFITISHYVELLVDPEIFLAVCHSRNFTIMYFALCFC